MAYNNNNYYYVVKTMVLYKSAKKRSIWEKKKVTFENLQYDV